MKDYFHPCESIINIIITFSTLINMNLDINFSVFQKNIYINFSMSFCLLNFKRFFYIFSIN